MKKNKVCVIGIGYFGFYLSKKLSQMNCELVVVEKDESRAELVKDFVEHVIVIDCLDQKALMETGISDCDTVVVAIGEDFESSLTTISYLQEMKINKILTRAISKTHERILRSMGIENIFLPEAEAADQVAREIVMKNVRDSITISDNYTIVEAEPPKWAVGKTLSECNLRKEYEVTVIAMVKETNTTEMISTGDYRKIDVDLKLDAETKVDVEKNLLLFGKDEDIYNFLEEN